MLLLLVCLLIISSVVLTQDLQIFPNALNNFFGRVPTIPEGIEEITFNSLDGKRIALWRVEAQGLKRKQPLFFFYGNGQTVATSTNTQRWYASQGFTVYTLEYRGYGRSEGFPSEKKVLMDAELALKIISQRESVPVEDVILFGLSIGSGPACYLARRFNARVLVLIAPYLSIYDVVRARPLLRYLAPFLWTRFMNKEAIAELTSTCVVAAHGKRDQVIPYAHSQQLRDLYRGSGSYTLVSSDEATHSDILDRSYEAVQQALDACLEINN